ncbi:conserved hypothetical protein [Vibrio cholerae MO10]|uniref:Uncharacterized protein n=1 Tax=Vibrio cholerae (strain MO10) TaxID=345072 RepID=A0A0X1L1T5_VIBCO|nr:hypothetical protein ASZ80_02962 [Vibrio cholerae]APF58052.1 hypothetical protein ASZ81_02962 [Vibrio cholerae]APF72901.1 hypothetical protein ASZ79_02933 [Vibrio cholerae]EAZ77045.1 hypothetical protein A5E_A0192 [Vibrio cholerae B33]EET24547.1 conserved hypothetical protein [Vibrio cholerae MO10]
MQGINEIPCAEIDSLCSYNVNNIYVEANAYLMLTKLKTHIYIYSMA